jgi:hypothetical protein
MAVGETARLIASLELQDKFSKNVAAYERSIDGMSRKTAAFDRLGNDIGRGIRNTTANIGRLAVAGGTILTVAITNGVRELERLESATAQTNAVIESTGGVAGQTADEIRNLAEKYEGLNATIDDKVIQSAENLLLTFTNVQDKAFEPALQAILDINTAMGGGEEGLQGVAIQVGKALNDPVRGLTALRRIGVSFSQTQEDQIKKLVEANDLYGAQQIILEELGREFGGSFAAAGDTAAGKFAKVRDAVEDAQAALATAFLPVLEKVADKLGTFLADPANVQRIEDFGGQLAEGFEKVLDTVGKLDFAAIGTSLQIAGTGAKAVFDAFTGLPPWIQTAVLTGWGLNKLTGGALGNIVGDIGKLAFAGRGTTPANPLFVSQVGGIGGAPVTGGGGGAGAFIKGFLGLTTAAGLGAIIGAEIGHNVFFDPTVAPAVKYETSQFEKLLASGNTEKMEHGLDTITDKLTFLGADNLLARFLYGEQLEVLESQRDILRTKLEQVHMAQLGMTAKTAEIQAAIHTEAARTLDTLRGQANSLIRLEEKKFDPTVNVNVAAVANISVSNVTRTLTSFRIAGSTTVGGFTESAF